MCHEAAGTLVPGMGALNHPALELHHEALGRRLWSQLLLLGHKRCP